MTTINKFVRVEELPTDIENLLANNFNQIFDHIKLIGNKKVVVYDKDNKEYYNREIFRHYKSFGYTPGFRKIGKSYMFNENVGKAYMYDESQQTKDTYVEPELDILKKLLSWANEFFGKANWNLYVNAYELDDYIEPHSDCTNSIQEDSDIIILSIYDKGANIRSLKFVSKTREDNFDVDLLPNSIIKINSKEQEKWRHSIDKGEGRRIGLTFRSMKKFGNSD